VLAQRNIYSEEHAIFRDAVRKFVLSEIAPNFARWEAQGIVDREYRLTRPLPNCGVVKCTGESSTSAYSSSGATDLCANTKYVACTLMRAFSGFTAGPRKSCVS
jgi:Acyl-CoA dehydrogenase, N-terminal domain